MKTLPGIESRYANLLRRPKPDHCGAPCYGEFRRKRRSRRYSRLRFLPFTSKMIFASSEINSVRREKADFRGRRLSGSLVFFHHCDVDHFTVGRVEMWRGGGRFGLSVAAPFVWRCPSNLAIASVSTSRCIEPDVQFSRIRLSDKTSRFRPRRVTLQQARQVNDAQLVIQIRVEIGRPATFLMLVA